MSVVVFTKSSIEATGTPATGPFYYRPLISPFCLMGFPTDLIIWASFLALLPALTDTWAFLLSGPCYRPFLLPVPCYRLFLQQGPCASGLFYYLGLATDLFE